MSKRGTICLIVWADCVSELYVNVGSTMGQKSSQFYMQLTGTGDLGILSGDKVSLLKLLSSDLVI